MILEGRNTVCEPRTPPNIGSTGSENLELCHGGANEGADEGEGSETRGDHVLGPERWDSR